MTVLICRRSDVQTHWQKMLASFRRVLPENGTYYGIETQFDSHVQLKMSNGPSETTVRYDGQRVHLVPFLDITPGQTQNYWLSWYEGWREPQTGPAHNRQQFASSSIAIYAGPTGSNKQQVLRAEWAGAEILGTGKSQITVFQGNGAAHPHWHLAGLEIADDANDPINLTETGSVTADTSLHDFAKELSGGGIEDRTDVLTLTRSVASERIDPAWASIHLATSANWAQAEWPGPGGPHDMHARNPVSCEEIRSWLISCVRYLQSELQGQILRGRR